MDETQGGNEGGSKGGNEGGSRGQWMKHNGDE